MTRRDPFSDIEELFERMDRELEKLGTGLDVPGRSDVDVDVIEGDEELTVLVDLPGFDDDEISVELRDETLTVGATPGGEESSDADDVDDGNASEADDGERYHLRERRHGSVSRRLPLPVAVEPSAASAGYDAGVLTVTLPKRSASGSDGHRIDVE
ncbi:Hsp20/alpha crystallin family protein [Halorubrum sp. 48-1-W]|uniref:Hsp20/alpha crystallin family protein n=1 Tax=Halorubrum sp. 48-1-W TaxID=2249761 RepID=UPI000DCD5DCC|nr:Hsp20/alpha crystallin family protein [Halorubrum sp. 48-1-W]RAW45276.1 Hsp20/alpha crystallin family protein [Halorubrum sp. 48-1-W]